MFFKHPHLDVAFKEVWVLGGTLSDHFGNGRAPGDVLVEWVEKTNGCPTYQLPEPTTVTLCFFAKGVKDDIFALMLSILVGEVVKGTRVVGRREVDKKENGIRRVKVGNKSIKWKRGKQKGQGGSGGGIEWGWDGI